MLRENLKKKNLKATNVDFERHFIYNCLLNIFLESWRIFKEKFV